MSRVPRARSFSSAACAAVDSRWAFSVVLDTHSADLSDDLRIVRPGEAAARTFRWRL